MAWTKARWTNPCRHVPDLDTDGSGIECTRKANHNGKWHKDGEDLF